MKTISRLQVIKRPLTVVRWVCSSPFFHFTVYLQINCAEAIAVANSIDFCCSFAFMVANNEPGIREKNDNGMNKNISITTYPISYPLLIDLFAWFSARANKNIKACIHSLRMSYWPNSVFVFIFLLFANALMESDSQQTDYTHTHKLNTDTMKNSPTTKPSTQWLCAFRTALHSFVCSSFNCKQGESLRL